MGGQGLDLVQEQRAGRRQGHGPAQPSPQEGRQSVRGTDAVKLADPAVAGTHRTAHPTASIFSVKQKSVIN